MGIEELTTQGALDDIKLHLIKTIVLLLQRADVNQLREILSFAEVYIS